MYIRDNFTDRPTPGLEPKTINREQHEAFTPRRLDYIDGYLIDELEEPKRRRDLLLLLLTNEGLAEVVRFAPPDLWRAALRQVYGDSRQWQT